jgi:hypothetical protein
MPVFILKSMKKTQEIGIIKTKYNEGGAKINKNKKAKTPT